MYGANLNNLRHIMNIRHLNFYFAGVTQGGCKGIHLGVFYKPAGFMVLLWSIKIFSL